MLCFPLNGGGGANELLLKSAGKTVLSFYGKYKYTWFFKNGMEILLTGGTRTGMEKCFKL